MNRMSQRGAGRNLDLVQQMPEPRKLTTIPRLALGLQMAAITFGNVHAVRTLPLVAFDMMLGEIRHRRINGFGRYEVLEQQLVTDVCLRARHGHHAVESKTQNVAFDFRHGTTGADEELVNVGLGPRTRRFCRLRHNMILISQRAVDINEYELATSHVAFRHMSNLPKSAYADSPLQRGTKRKIKPAEKGKVLLTPPPVGLADGFRWRRPKRHHTA